MISDVTRLGRGGRRGRGRRGAAQRLESRLAAVREAVAGAPRPRVLALEWLDPAFIGGHWVPEMIELAGGEDALGEAGKKSRTAEWDEAAAAGAEVVVAMPCGWDSVRARKEVLEHSDRVAALGAERVYRRRRCGLVLASRAAPGRGHGTARPPAASGQGRRPGRGRLPGGGAYQPPSARRSYLTSLSPSSKTRSFDSVNRSRNHSESSRPTPLRPAPPNGASWSQ